MNFNAYVMEDLVNEYTRKDGTKAVGRNLSLLDLSEGSRVLEVIRMSIPVDCPVAGPGSQGASLRDRRVLVDVRAIRQFDWGKKPLGFDGEVLRVEGDPQPVPAPASAGKKAA